MKSKKIICLHILSLRKILNKIKIDLLLPF